MSLRGGGTANYDFYTIELTLMELNRAFKTPQVSSQYVSSVLLSAPYAKAPLTLKLAEEHPTSLPYILMTLETMKSFGVHVKVLADNCFVVPTGNLLFQLHNLSNLPCRGVTLKASSYMSS